ncbi:hypothetical protein ED733_002125 [Metarhizium rileyi]|nr:hypothetical protein ED733_002125 [Metarhizium rileyi]
MYVPDVQKMATAGLALAGVQLSTYHRLTLLLLALGLPPYDRLTQDPSRLAGDTVSKGSVLDYAVEKCIDKDGNVRCSKPFPVRKESCYKLEWSTDGTFSHTTVEIRDAGSGEMVYYRDTNGEWKPEKNELVYLDFKPKVWGTGNDTVDYEVKKCDKDNEL